MNNYNGTHTTTVGTSMLPVARLARMDWLLIFCSGLIIAIGLALIAGVSPSTGSSNLAVKQVLFLALGIGAFVAMQRFDYLMLLRWAPSGYLFCLILLIGVLFTRAVNGAHSWFNLYVFNLQPSEIMKPILILTLAHYLMYRDSYKRLTGLLVPLILCLVPMALILRQPDLGTALVLVPVGFAMLFTAGARIGHLALVVLCGAAGLTGMWFTVMKAYQKRRILAWLNPNEYELREAWQLIQSETAIGSGGFWGRGWGQSAQGGMNLLPEKHTDFIFAVLAEDGGFFLASLLLLLLAFWALSGLTIALRTREPAGRLIAIGMTTLLTSQALINVGVSLGLLPTTGVTFPFLSYGGSSLLSSIICLGVLVNIGASRKTVLASESFTSARDR